MRRHAPGNSAAERKVIGPTSPTPDIPSAWNRAIRERVISRSRPILDGEMLDKWNKWMGHLFAVDIDQGGAQT